MDSTGRQTNTALLSCCTQNLAPSEDGCPALAELPGIAPSTPTREESSLEICCFLICQFNFGADFCLWVGVWGWTDRWEACTAEKNVVCKCFLHRNQNKVLFPDRNLLRWVRESPKLFAEDPGCSGPSQPFSGSNSYLQKKSCSHKQKSTKSLRSTSCF